MTNSETWRPVIGYEGFYEVSTLGSVRSLTRITRNGRGPRVCTGKALKAHPDKDGYMLCHLNVNGKGSMIKVHRAVAAAFIANESGRPEINHKNGVKSDNRVENLEWSTRSENNLHAFRVLGRAPVCHRGPRQRFD